MARSRSRASAIRAVAIFVLGVAFACSGLLPMAHALAPDSNAVELAGAAPQSEPVPGASSGAAAVQQAAGHDTAQQPDERAAFRHSRAVSSVGRRFHLSPEPAARLFEFINFALLVGGVLYFFLRFFPRYLRTHRDHIRKQLLDARTANEQANAELKAVERKMLGLDEEIRQLREQAAREAVAEEEHIRAVIEAERQRILASADREIAAAAAEARRELRRFAGTLAIERARGMLSLSSSDDRALTAEIAGRLRRQAARGTASGAGSEDGHEVEN